MRKVLIFVALLCCALSGFAEKKSIRLKRGDLPNERSLVQSPIASIEMEEELLTIEFPSSTSFMVSVVNETGEVVYSGTYSAEMAILTLSNLSAGEYTLVINDSNYNYIGEFEIE